MKVRMILAKKGKKVITIHPEDTIKEATVILANYRIGALVVVDIANKPIGILSERDIVKRAATDDAVLSRKVSDLMTKDVITATPQDDTFSIAHTMTEKRFRHMPIVDDNELIGIISIGDILKAERDQYRGEIDTLETQIMANES